MGREKKEYKYLDILSYFYLTMILAIVCIANRFIHIWIFTWPGGMLFFPLTFTLISIVGETYGYERARRLAWLGLAASAIFAFLNTVVSHLPAPDFFEHTVAYKTVFDPTIWFVISSGVGLITGEMINLYLNAKIKVKWRGKLFLVRCFTSIAVGQLLLTIIVDFMAFYLKAPLYEILNMIVTGYLWKMFVTFILLFFVWLAVKYLKIAEKEDYYDYNTNFNPFKISVGI